MAALFGMFCLDNEVGRRRILYQYVEVLRGLGRCEFSRSYWQFCYVIARFEHCDNCAMRCENTLRAAGFIQRTYIHCMSWENLSCNVVRNKFALQYTKVREALFYVGKFNIHVLD